MSRFLKAFWSSFAASSSSAGMSDGSISMIVTSVPKRLKIDANSQPMIPPPRMTSRRGTCRLREEPGRVDAARRVDPGDRRPHGVRAGRDDRLLEGDVLRSLDGDRVRPGEPAPAVDPLTPFALKSEATPPVIWSTTAPFHPATAPQSSVGSPTTTPSFANVSFASWKACALCTQARDAAHAQAGAAEGIRLVDAGDLRAELGGADGGRVSGRAASEDGDVDVHSVSVPSFVGDVGSNRASIVRESASSPTRRSRGARTARSPRRCCGRR